MSTGDRLTSFQLEVARLFFGLSAGKQFLLAGGASLAAQGLTERPTEDLDFFTTPARADSVLLALTELTAACRRKGWTVTVIRRSETFARVAIDGEGAVLVDLAVDSEPRLPSHHGVAGPTFDPLELAGRKLLALYDRAAARDFVDVHALVGRFGTQPLLDMAADVDPGLDLDVLADMFDTIARYDDGALALGPNSDPTALRSFFARWAGELKEPTENSR
ncbi:MAG: nucleotidyl transferase AbiEii/AbiGii toxin family protein [Dermatophilaceae bacterium]